MILNDKQFKLKVKEDGTKCIFFYEGHSPIDHDTTRPFKRIGGGKDEHLTNEECLQQLGQFSKDYPESYSCYIHTTSASITKNGFFCKIDLRVKEKEADRSTPAPELDREQLRKEFKKEFMMEQSVETLTEELKYEKEVNAHNDLIGNKLASVAYKVLQQFGSEMTAGGPMQGPPPADGAQQETGQQTEKKEPTMNIDEAFEYLKVQLGNEFIVTLADKIKESNEKGEVPTLATKLKSML